LRRAGVPRAMVAHVMVLRAAPRYAWLAGRRAIRMKVPKPVRRDIDGVRRTGGFAERRAVKEADVADRHVRRASPHAGSVVIAHTVARRLQMSWASPARSRRVR